MTDDDVGNVTPEDDEIDGLDLAITTLESFAAVVPPSVWVLDGVSVKAGFAMALKILRRLQKFRNMQNV